MPDRLHVGRHVLVDPGAAADEGVSADGDELVNRDQAAEVGAILDGHVPGDLGRVGDGHAVADLAVVRQMDVGHEEAARPDPGRARKPAVPRLMVAYSRMTVPAPTSTQVSSPWYLNVLRLAAQHRSRPRSGLPGPAARCARA